MNPNLFLVSFLLRSPWFTAMLKGGVPKSASQYLSDQPLDLSAFQGRERDVAKMFDNIIFENTGRHPTKFWFDSTGFGVTYTNDAFLNKLRKEGTNWVEKFRADVIRGLLASGGLQDPEFTADRNAQQQRAGAMQLIQSLLQPRVNYTIPTLLNAAQIQQGNTQLNLNALLNSLRQAGSPIVQGGQFGAQMLTRLFPAMGNPIGGGGNPLALMFGLQSLGGGLDSIFAPKPAKNCTIWGQIFGLC